MFVAPILGVSASADEDPVEPPETFCGYEVLGYDAEGNAELSNEDYEEYFNNILAERAAQIDAGIAPMTYIPAPKPQKKKMILR